MRNDAIPELKQLLGALFLAAKEPLSEADLRRVLRQTGERHGGVYADFAKIDDESLLTAIREFGEALEAAGLGIRLARVAGGWRLENEEACGPWLRVLLQRGRGGRLTQAALETLAVIAYRQPCPRSEVEAVRGVAADAAVKRLLEMGLVRLAGRSDLPGRPWNLATTPKFLRHFGLDSLKDLPRAEEVLSETLRQGRGGKAAGGAVAGAAPPEASTPPADDNDNE